MIDVTQVINELGGGPVLVGEEGKEEVLTLRLVCTRSLTAILRQDDSVKGEEKLRRGMLAERIYVNDEVELKAEEVALVKELVGRLYGPLVVLRVWRMLDPAE